MNKSPLIVFVKTERRRVQELPNFSSHGIGPIMFLQLPVAFASPLSVTAAAASMFVAILKTLMRESR